MTRIMAASGVRARLLWLLDEVADGEEIEITKHGKTVARLVPAEGQERLRGRLAGVAASAADEEERFSTDAAWDPA